MLVARPVPPRVIERVAFGSCSDQDHPPVIWDAIQRSRPDLFLFMGDNVYADTSGELRLRESYAKLSRMDGFRRLRGTTPILATWDDHDYGRNDAGADFPHREESRRIFLDFFAEPAGSWRRKTPGVHDARVYGPPGKRLQIILLDTRYFRSPLVRSDGFLGIRPPGYVPARDPSRTMLGTEQWDWLEAQLRRPAELRLIVSSIQVLPVDHRFEKWFNLPHERERLFDLVRRTGAGRVVLLSGDRHFAELSRLDKTVANLPYPLYEVTSSGMTRPWTRGPEEKNRFRLRETTSGLPAGFGGFNFGLIKIQWSGPEAGLTVRVLDETGTRRIEHRIPFKEISRSR